MPETIASTPTPIPTLVPTEEFEARVPEAYRGQFVDDDGGKKKRMVLDYGEENPAALRNAHERVKLDLKNLKAKYDPYAALGTPEELADLATKAKTPPTPSEGAKPDDAALQSAKDSLAAMSAKLEAHKARELELQGAADASKARWMETERRNEFLREMAGLVKPGGVKTILKLMMNSSRTDLGDDGNPVTIHLKDDDSEDFGDKLDRLTTPEKLARLRAHADWRDFFIPSPANGTGATPGRAGAGGSKTMNIAQFDKLPAADQLAYSREVAAGQATLTD